MTQEQIREYLRFYRDLGFEEIYRRKAPSMQSSPDAARAVEAQRVAEMRPESGSLSRASRAVNARGTRPAAAMPGEQPLAPLAAQPGEGPPPAASSDLFAQVPADAPRETLDQIRADLGECTRCRLHDGRRHIVFGVGNEQAKLVFVGEGPGADEDAQGIPFVGRAGQLLTQMIENTAAREGLLLKRADVYICNVVKCRPPENRTPERDEMDTCSPFLFRQLESIRPKAICVLGGTAAKALLSTTTGITHLRGKWQSWRGIPVMPTYHPSFLLRGFNAAYKKEAWEDLKKVLHYVYG